VSELDEAEDLLTRTLRDGLDGPWLEAILKEARERGRGKVWMGLCELATELAPGQKSTRLMAKRDLDGLAIHVARVIQAVADPRPGRGRTPDLETIVKRSQTLRVVERAKNAAKSVRGRDRFQQDPEAQIRSVAKVLFDGTAEDRTRIEGQRRDFERTWGFLPDELAGPLPEITFEECVSLATLIVMLVRDRYFVHHVLGLTEPPGPRTDYKLIGLAVARQLDPNALPEMNEAAATPWRESTLAMLKDSRKYLDSYHVKPPVIAGPGGRDAAVERARQFIRTYRR